MVVVVTMILCLPFEIASEHHSRCSLPIVWWISSEQQNQCCSVHLHPHHLLRVYNVDDLYHITHDILYHKSASDDQNLVDGNIADDPYQMTTPTRAETGYPKGTHTEGLDSSQLLHS